MAISLSPSSAMHTIQLILFESPSTPLPHLLSAAALLSRADYADVVTERSIADLCGYPCCPNPLPSPSARARGPRYRVSLRDHRVFDLEEAHKFCSDDCHVSSAAFGEGLSEGRRADVDVGRRKIEEVMAVFGSARGAEDRGGGVGGKLVIREKIGGGEVTAEEWIGPANAIEGYIPMADRGVDNVGHSDTENTRSLYAMVYFGMSVRDQICVLGFRDKFWSVHGWSRILELSNYLFLEGPFWHNLWS